MAPWAGSSRWCRQVADAEYRSERTWPFVSEELKAAAAWMCRMGGPDLGAILTQPPNGRRARQFGRIVSFRPQLTASATSPVAITALKIGIGTRMSRPVRIARASTGIATTVAAKSSGASG